MDEYPKVIDIAGQKITVTDAEDEARWLARPVAAAVVAEPDAVVTEDEAVPDAPPEEVVETDPTPKKKKSKYYEHSRLPDGTRFEVKYNAELQEWHGELILVNAVNDIYTFTERSSGVFRLLMKLDTLYRKHLEAAVQAALPLDK